MRIRVENTGTMVSNEWMFRVRERGVVSWKSGYRYVWAKTAQEALERAKELIKNSYAEGEVDV